MEYGGLVIYHMRLEHGHFHLPVINTEEGRIKSGAETFWNDLDDGSRNGRQQGQAL